MVRAACPPLPQQQSRVFDAETGDVILVLQEQEHSVFKRNEPLLVEAELEITFLGCRKTLVTTSPGEIVQSMRQGSDPFENHDTAGIRPASSSL